MVDLHFDNGRGGSILKAIDNLTPRIIQDVYRNAELFFCLARSFFVVGGWGGGGFAFFVGGTFLLGGTFCGGRHLGGGGLQKLKKKNTHSLQMHRK